MLRLNAKATKGRQGLVFPFTLPTGYRGSARAVIRELKSSTARHDLTVRAELEYEEKMWRNAIQLPKKPLGSPGYTLFEIFSNLRRSFETEKSFFDSTFSESPSVETIQSGTGGAGAISLSLPPGFFLVSRKIDFFGLLGFRGGARFKKVAEEDVPEGFVADPQGDWFGLANENSSSTKAVSKELSLTKTMVQSLDQEVRTANRELVNDGSFNLGPYEFAYGRMGPSLLHFEGGLPETSCADAPQSLVQSFADQILPKLWNLARFKEGWLRVGFAKDETGTTEGTLTFTKTETPFKTTLHFNAHAQTCLRLAEASYSWGTGPAVEKSEGWTKSRRAVPEGSLVVSSTHEPLLRSFFTDLGTLDLLGEMTASGNVRRGQVFVLDSARPLLELSFLDAQYVPVTFDSDYSLTLTLEYYVVSADEA